MRSTWKMPVMATTPRIRRPWFVFFTSLAFAATAVAGDVDYEHESIGYSRAPAKNAVTRLQQSIANGELKLDYDKRTGWLRSLLKEVGVPESSQTLVFSKTSMQRHCISPRRPRAVYFNDDVYVGYCQAGSVIELAAADPRLGTVFYTLDQTQAEAPKFTRQSDNCLICHASSSQTNGYPGLVVRSVFVDRGGFPVLSAGTYRTDHTSPLKQRWGGWYVTGAHGQQTHLGNLLVSSDVNPNDVDNAGGQNVTDLSERFPTKFYPTPHSDIVALMVLEHQCAIQNRITQANFLTRRALWDEALWDKTFEEPSDTHRESTIRRIRHAGDPLVECLLFSGEARLTGPVAGTSGFEREFAARGPRDSHGRSLRNFDLKTRMFKYPCSYLIYSESFDALPSDVKEYVWRRLWEVLSGRDTSQEFAHLSQRDRQAILEILRETKPGLPDSWQTARANHLHRAP